MKVNTAAISIADGPDEPPTLRRPVHAAPQDDAALTDDLSRRAFRLPSVETLTALARSNSTQIAAAHRAIWERKPILREIYHDYYRQIADCLAEVDGPTIEVGGGPGTLKTSFPQIISSDVVATPWLDFAADACALPLADASVANLVMVDVLHHLPCPRRFFAEAVRVLKPGGRLVILDPYVGPMSWPVFRFLHPEPATLSVRPLDQPQDEPLFDPTSPWNSDQGIARAVFWKQPHRFRELFPELAVVHRRCLSTLLWPLSGGFARKSRVPRFARPLLWRMERLLERCGRFFCYRCLLALERTEEEAL